MHAEHQRGKRKYTETVAEFDRKFTANFDKRLAGRESAINQRWEQRFSQFARQFQQPRKEAEPAPAPDMFENPTVFLDHGVKQHLDPVNDPVNQRISSLTESFSRRLAIKEHGAEMVQAAFSALDQAARAGERCLRSTVC